jgi:carbamoyltransferase
MPRRSVTVLGINDGHDSGAALIRNGSVLAALQEERPRNIKHFTGTPEHAIREVFKIGNVHPSEVDLIAMSGLVGQLAPLGDRSLSVKLLESASPYFASHSFAKLYVRVFHKLRKKERLRKVFSAIGIEDKEAIFVEHHMAHASCAYRSCPWSYDEPILVFTADGAGDGLSSTVNVGEKGQIKRIAESIYYDSLGNAMYSEITRFLGLKPWDHEYKVMGLAPYGKPEYCIDQVKKIIRVNPEKPLQFQNRIRAYCQDEQPKLRRLLAGQRFDNIASATQLWFEELMIRWIRCAVEETGIRKIACAGGLFLNVKANKRIVEMPEINDAFFYPAAGDDGTPVGAALQGYHDYCVAEGIKPDKQPMADAYYGPSFGDDEVKQALEKTGWIEKAEYYGDVDSTVGELVAKGQIVARFGGRLEWGPRALGNRSILADARDLRVVRKINFAIKQRDFWMPFAPTILENRIDEYVTNGKSAPYMIMAFDTTEKRDEIIAGVHPFDFSCRPQTLNDSWNPNYRKAVEAFENLTGVGGLLNTSFNLHGYPIVCTPEQAIWTFENSGLDAISVGNYLIVK